jgi:hypothetical protein
VGGSCAHRPDLSFELGLRPRTRVQNLNQAIDAKRLATFSVFFYLLKKISKNMVVSVSFKRNGVGLIISMVLLLYYYGNT